MRSIYLKEELDLICKDIQKHYESRLPALRLVALAAYEQLFNRQVIDCSVLSFVLLSSFINSRCLDR